MKRTTFLLIVFMFLIAGCGSKAKPTDNSASQPFKPIPVAPVSGDQSAADNAKAQATKSQTPASVLACHVVFNGFAEYKGGSLDVYKNGKKIGTIYSMKGGNNQQLTTPIKDGDVIKVDWQPAANGQYMDSRFAVSVWNLQGNITAAADLLSPNTWQEEKKDLVSSLGGDVGPNQSTNSHTYTFQVNKLVEN